MPTPAPATGLQILLELPAVGPRREALEHAIRDAVVSKRLSPGDRLPSTRFLAQQLGLGRGTVNDAYTHLIAEGWLTARTGSGTRVAALAAAGAPGPRPDPLALTDAIHDLSPGRPDPGTFPRRAWAAAIKEVVATAPNEAFGYGDPRGRPELREALAGYLGRVRGVRTVPEQILVCSGYTQALGLVAGVLAARRPAGPVAMEDPALPDHVSIVASHLPVLELPVDAHGLDVGVLTTCGAQAVVCTPAHQFPSGVELSRDRRERVLAWAQSTAGWIVEDDYDGNFSYERRPVSALQSGSPEQVLYVGSTSKSLGAAVRLGWIVSPSELIEPLAHAKRLADRQTSPIDQLALTVLLNNGGYDRHLVSVRRLYRQRRDQLVAAVRLHLPTARVLGIAAGLHVLVELPPGGPPESVVVQALQDASIRVHPYGGYLRGKPPQEPAQAPVRVVVGYAAPSSHAYGAALEALVTTLAEVVGERAPRRSTAADRPAVTPSAPAGESLAGRSPPAKRSRGKQAGGNLPAAHHAAGGTALARGTQPGRLPGLGTAPAGIRPISSVPAR